MVWLCSFFLCILSIILSRITAVKYK
jgi:hypothetical protein